MLEHHFPCHVPSKTVFIKHASVVDILCNHKSAIETWSLDTTPTCCCQGWHKFRSAALNPGSDHWVLSGSLLTDLLPPDVAVLAEGSLQNKVFPQKREFLRILLAILNWCKFNGLPSIPKHQIQDLGTHTHTPHTSQTISLVPPFNTLNNCSKGQSSIVKTNMSGDFSLSHNFGILVVSLRPQRHFMPENGVQI